MLEIKDLEVYVENKKIIDKLNLKINKGEIVALMGPNGSGKSTLCYAILKHPNYKLKGKILFEGKNLTEKDTSEIAKDILLIMQQPRELEGIKIKDMLRKAYKAREQDDKKLIEFVKQVRKKAEEYNIDLNREVNKNFSGGEKKKQEMLSLLLDPKLLIVDEIDSGLDVDSLKIIAKELKEYNSKGGTILIISHYKRILELLKPNKVIIMKNGKIIKQGDYSLVEEIEEKGYQ